MANSRRLTAELMSPYELSPACACHPPIAPLPPPMPMPGIPVSVFEDMLYQIAVSAGYNAGRDSFRADFANALNGTSTNQYAVIIQKSSYKDFPKIGITNGIYIDTDQGQAYYWAGDGYYLLAGSETIIDNDYIDQRIDEVFLGKIIDGGNANIQ